MGLTIRSFIPGFIWFIVIFILLILPGSSLPEAAFLDKIYFDKWVHIGLFAMLVFLYSYPLLKIFKPYSFWYVIISLSGWLYGIIMEFIQKDFLTNRSFDLWDIVADGIGCFIGYFFFMKQLKKRTALK